MKSGIRSNGADDIQQSHNQDECDESIVSQVIKSAIIFGYASLVDGIVVRMFDESGARPKVIATGSCERDFSKNNSCGRD